MGTDAVVIEKLYKDFFPALCVFSFRYTRDMDAARDICQDAFLYIWKKKIRFNTIDSARSYLFKYARNRCINYLRDKQSQNEKLLKISSSEEYFHNTVIETEAYDTLCKALVLLPKQGQRIINLTLDGLKNYEIAEIMGISENTVKTLKRKAYKTLRLELDENILTCLVMFENTPQTKK